MKKLVFFLLSVLAVVSGCRREDIREVTLEVPALAAENVETVRQALVGFNGVRADRLKFDLTAKTVFVVYDSMQVAQTNLRMAIQAAGVEVRFPENTTGRAGH